MADEKPSFLWQIKATVPKDTMPILEGAFYALGSVVLTAEIEKGSNKGKWQIEAICEEKPDNDTIERLLALSGRAIPYVVEKIANKNWLKENIKLFPPVEAGRYYVYGSHIKEAPCKDKISLCIDAATAFGSGKHQTTKGCLMALNDLAKNKNYKPKNILDMGCGSGILGLAAAKTFHVPVLAVDIDAESVRVARLTSVKNRLGKYVRAEVGNGYKKGTVADKTKYDLIFANILARPLTLMAKDLSKHLSPTGTAILSGLLNSQEEWVVKAHALVGLKLKKRYRIDEWSTLIVRKT